MAATPDDADLPEDRELFEAARACLRQHGIVRHQTESFDHFLNESLPLIVQENSDVTAQAGRYTYHVQWTNVVVMQPTVRESSGFERTLTPDAARLRSLTYSSNVVCDVVHDKIDKASSQLVFRKVYRQTVLARLPVLLGSSACVLRDQGARGNECLLDPLGYFIINGIEKTMIAQEKLRCNAAFVFHSKNSKFTHYCECRSCHELKLRSTSTLLLHATRFTSGFSNILVEFPFIKLMIPLPSAFKLLGVPTAEDAMRIVCAGGDLDATLQQSVAAVFENDPHRDMDRAQILEWVAKEGTTEVTPERRERFLTHIVSNECLPHMSLRSTATGLRKKAIFMGHMVSRLVRVTHGIDMVDDRDDWKQKRVDASGTLMSLLFRQLFRTFLRTVSVAQYRLIDKGTIDTANLGDVVSQKKISSGFRYAFSTGNWGHKNQGGQSGVVQIMGRQTTLSAASNLRRVSCPLSRESKSTRPRLLHVSSYGLVCPVESPEGPSCGLVKSLSLLCHVRTGTPSTGPIAELLLANEDGVTITPLSKTTDDCPIDQTAVLVNGVIVGYVPKSDAPRLVDAVRKRRRAGTLPFDLSVGLLGNGTVQVHTDPGTLMCPMIVASEVHRFSDLVRTCPIYENAWERLLAHGVIEYLDKMEEQSYARVALTVIDLADHGKRYTHAHIHPCFALGVCASLIPYCSFNQSPRNTYQSAMSKQAIGFVATNYNRRFETISHVRSHAQRPLVSTVCEAIASDPPPPPSGENVICAIACYMGFNQEDSLIVSQSACDRGLFRSHIYRTYRDEERSNGADAETFENPSLLTDVQGMRHEGYEKLDASGIVAIGQELSDGDAVIGKTILISDLSVDASEVRKTTKRCKTTFMRNDERCVVDATLVSKTREGNRLVKVRTRAQRICCCGDKLASRHGQKGVIGVVLPDYDMPVDEDGITPDVIINPHAIPSRMTVGQLVEQLMGRVCCEEGRIGDGTPFIGTDPERIADQLVSHGLSRYGQSRMTCGITGEHMKMLMVQGPTYYQRLKHMVVDKIHARSLGPTAFLTRQPIEGRSREGGLRIGEMERDCMISHGAAAVMQDRLLECSDAFATPLCRTCGLAAECIQGNAVLGHSETRCRACGAASKGVVVKTQPYAYKLFTQELMAMHIAPRSRLEENVDVAFDPDHA